MLFDFIKNRFYIFFISLLFTHLATVSFVSYAQVKEDYTLLQVANLQHKSLNNPQWLKPLSDPTDKEQYYLAEKSGKIYFIQDGQIQPNPILDLAALNKNSSDDIVLSAMTLHPSFALRDQDGYGIFYTAHVEKIDKNSKTKRLINRDDKTDFALDTVITEWQFNRTNFKKVELDSRRELIRISINDQKNTIGQLSFNPNKKSWNDDYALLFFSLAEDKSLPKWSVYSGNIFRINPKKFGRKNYTIPASNPFNNNNDIENEIYLLAAQDIHQFSWPQKNRDELLISHKYNAQELLSIAHNHLDWRVTAPEKILSTDNQVSSVLMYQGRDLPAIRNRWIFLNKNTHQWQLNSINNGDKNELLGAAEVEWSIDNLLADNLVKLFIDRTNELLILDQSDHLLYKISSPSVLSSSAKIDTLALNTNQNDEHSVAIILVTFLILMLAGVLFIRKSILIKRSVSVLVNRNFAQMELNETKDQVSLFKRHFKTTDTILSVADLNCSEVQLNGGSIILIDNSVDHGFSEEKEATLRLAFAKEYTDKMIDEKVRQIDLILTNKKEEAHTISLYVRKGNQRVTKKPFKDIIEELIDWCWLVAKTLNPDNTGERKPRATLKSISQSNKRSIKPRPYLVNDPVKTRQTSSDEEPSADKITPVINTEGPITDSDVVIRQSYNRELPSSLINTELVNSLEKLVKLKQQGFLSDEEFANAKKNLLKDLI